METRRLGDSGLELSAIGLGSWLTYAGGIGRERTEACTRAAFEAGITFFDTANVLRARRGRAGVGRDPGRRTRATPTCWRRRCTSRWARATAGSRASRSSSRSTRRWSGCGPTTSTSTSATATTTTTPLEETMGALTEVVEAGKARFIGFSEWPVERIEQALALPGVARFVSSQPQYSALWREPEREVFPLCARHGIGQVVWSPLAQGVLTRQVPPRRAAARPTRARPARWAASWAGCCARRRSTPSSACARSPSEAGLTMSQLALAWVLRSPHVTSAIVGASRPEQVRRERGGRRRAPAGRRGRRGRRGARARRRAGAVGLRPSGASTLRRAARCSPAARSASRRRAPASRARARRSPPRAPAGSAAWPCRARRGRAPARGPSRPALRAERLAGRGVDQVADDPEPRRRAPARRSARRSATVGLVLSTTNGCRVARQSSSSAASRARVRSRSIEIRTWVSSQRSR